MKTIELNGETYTCTLSTRFRRHKPEETEAMRESIEEVGIKVPVRIYRDTTLGLERCVLDGEGRLGIAVEVGADVPVIDDGEMSTEEAYERATLFNDARRQDDPAEVRKRRKERIARVAAARAAGKSTRQIAEEEGVSQPQVLRDLKAAGDTYVSPEPEPAGVHPRAPDTNGEANGTSEEYAPAATATKPPTKKPPKVTGRDGKTYPTTAAPKLCKRCQRTGAVRDCARCAEVQAAAKNGSQKKVRPGAPAYDDRPINDAIGKLARMFNDRAQALGHQKAKGWNDVRGAMESLLAAWDRWRVERVSA